MTSYLGMTQSSLRKYFPMLIHVIASLRIVLCVLISHALDARRRNLALIITVDTTTESSFIDRSYDEHPEDNTTSHTIHVWLQYGRVGKVPSAIQMGELSGW